MIWYQAYRDAERRIEIARQKGATKLDLNNMELTKVPNTIASLSQLKVLYLNYNELTEIPKAITALSQLKQLNLNRNQLTKIPEAIASLSRLQQLKLSSNQLTKIPEAIASLSQLKKLDLSGNQLTEIPEAIASLSQLQVLSLSKNQLTEIPEAIASLSQLTTLKLDNNPLNPDLAVAYEQGIEAVKQYLRAKAEEQIELFEAKLILVGEGEVGKSCLLGALRGDEWVEGRPTTHGIEIKPVVVPDPDTGKEITLNGWDFGGQRIYRPTHQLFFSTSAVYLVVWKPREGHQQGFVREWITLIKHREPEAKVLVVATHGGPGQRQPDIDRQELLDLFGSDTVLGFFYVDSNPETGCKGIAELKQAIVRAAAALPSMGRSVPAKWQRVRQILQTSEETYLPYPEVIALCQKQGIDAEQAELFLKISHTLGHLIHYHYDTSLRNIVILKPDWLAKAISFVLDDKSTRDRHGLVEFAHLSHLWSHPPASGETGYPQALHPVFLRLMEKFDLSYQVVLGTEETNTSLIAQLVPDNRPEHLPAWGDHPEPGNQQQVQICRIVDEAKGLSAVADGLFYRLIVRLHKYSLGRTDYKNSIHWQRGLMLDNDYNGRALLEYQDTDIKITVRAAYPDRFLSYLTEEIKWLIKDFWKGLECIEMVPCIAPCGRKQPGQGLFEVKRIVEYRSQGLEQFPCMVPGCFQLQNIDALMQNAPTSQPSSVEKLVQEFGEVKEKLSIIHQEIQTSDDRKQQRFENLNENDRRLLSQADERFAGLMQMLTDEAKEGPRLFSFKPVDPKFFDRPKWLSAKFQIVLWCEHSRQPLPTLNPPGSKQGVYELELPREWFVKAAPLLKIMTTTLGLILPIAGSATKFILDDTTYKDIEEQLDLGEKTLESVFKGSELATDWQSEHETPNLDHGEAIRAQGSMLRTLHALLKEKDPSFGGLEQVQNKRREFLWVHPQFVDEY